jgi:hypothetical protein
VGRSKVHLYHALSQHVTSTHCDAIDEYGLVLRVDGSIQTFGPEGISRLRFARKQRYITLDIQIPESVWRPLDDTELRSYLGTQVDSAIRACVSRLKKDGFDVDDWPSEGVWPCFVSFELKVKANEVCVKHGKTTTN